jgi:HK97 family phage major capsid protein
MRHRAFSGRGPETEARYLRAGQWILATIYENEKAASWCKTNGVPLVKAAGESIGTGGAFLVPTDLANAILDIRDMYGAFRRRARLVPMASDNTTVGRHTGTSAFFIGENTAATETSTIIDAVGLTAKKIGVLVRISSELEEDAITDIVDFVANEIGIAFAAQEDDCAFNGDGTSTYGRMRGISSIVLDGFHNKAKVAAAATHNTFALIDSTDLGNLMSSVRAAAIPNAAWYCSQTGFAQTFCRLSTASGYLETRIVDGISTPFYQGFPVILTQKLPLVGNTGTPLTGKVMMAFGDMYLGSVLGQRRSITLARSADRYMDQDQIAVLGTERFHSVIADIGDNTNFGALAALVGTS